MFIDVSIVKKWPMFDNEHRVNSRSVVIIAFITSGQNPLSVLGDQILGGQKSLSVSWKPNDSGHASRLPSLFTTWSAIASLFVLSAPMLPASMVSFNLLM